MAVCIEWSSGTLDYGTYQERDLKKSHNRDCLGGVDTKKVSREQGDALTGAGTKVVASAAILLTVTRALR